MIIVPKNEYNLDDVFFLNERYVRSLCYLISLSPSALRAMIVLLHSICSSAYSKACFTQFELKIITKDSDVIRA